MIFSEDIVLRCAHFEGNNLTRHSGCPLALCRFGPLQSQSLIAIAQTLDRLLVYDLSLLLISEPSSTGEHQQPKDVDRIQVIAIKDQVISGLEVVAGSTIDGQDILLIGCANSIMIYATREQTHLSSVNTSARPAVISSIQLAALASHDPLAGAATVLVCAGVQKLSTYQLLKGAHDYNKTSDSATSRFHPALDLSSERTVSESITCLACGTHDQLAACLVTGSREHTIKVYPIDAFDQNIRAPRLTLDETGPVSCLCAIETLQISSSKASNPNQSNNLNNRAKRDSDGQVHATQLPSLEHRQHSAGRLANSRAPPDGPALQMNYLAYGLENGTIGVYHLLTVLDDDDKDEEREQEEEKVEGNRTQVMMGERLWRHKSKQTPVSLVMFDCNGDGLDELVVGYRNGRLEVRSPFTGQLLAATRLFGGGAQLVGLVAWPLELHGPASEARAPSGSATSEQTERSRHALLACSSSSSLVAIRPRQKRPREPLRDYLARSGRDLRALARAGGEQRLASGQVLVEDARELASAAGACEPLQLDIETRGDNLRPVASESRQSAQLMQKIGVLSNEQGEMGARLRKLHQEWVSSKRQAESRSKLANSQEPESVVHIAHSWDFDATRHQLRLTLHVGLVSRPLRHNNIELEPSSPPRAVPTVVDMIELVDADSGETLERGRHRVQLFVIGPGGSGGESPAGPIEFWLDASQTGGAGGKSSRNNVWRRLRVRVFCRPTGTASQLVYEHLVEPGPYATFVPQSLFSVTGSAERPEVDKATLVFGLPDRMHRLQAIDWLQTNFLCFHYGQVQVDESIRDPILLDMLQYSADSIVDVGGIGTSGGGGGGDDENGDELLEFRFVDLRRVGAGVPTGGHLRICFTSDQTNELVSMETDDSDLLVELVKSLALGRLQLSMQKHLLTRRDHRPRAGLEPLMRELSSLIENSRQLEESENRIQTEIYESAEFIKQLMQQFAIANQLNEFATSRELLGEIAMMLDRTQNSAQSYQLNSRSRQELTREATCLREKISFLTGGGGSSSSVSSAAAAAAAN